MVKASEATSFMSHILGASGSVHHNSQESKLKSRWLNSWSFCFRRPELCPESAFLTSCKVMNGVYREKA